MEQGIFHSNFFYYFFLVVRTINVSDSRQKQIFCLLFKNSVCGVGLVKLFVLLFMRNVGFGGMPHVWGC